MNNWYCNCITEAGWVLILITLGLCSNILCKLICVCFFAVDPPNCRLL